MQIALAVFDGFTALDALGPYQVLSQLPGAETLLVAEQAGPVTDSGRLTVTAHAAYHEVTQPDVVVVAGGLAAVELAEAGGPVVEWVRRVSLDTRWCASVCTGALILGAAGVLAGRRATTHWHFVDRLRQYGATPVRERFVVDDGIATAAGVSAGLDLSLALAAELSDDATAMAIQLDLEYAPAPPFAAGSPATAPPQVVARLEAAYDRLA